MEFKGFWQRKFVKPIIDLVNQGITLQKIVLSIAIGATLGVIPVPGATTILCTIAAILFRLNLPAIQLVNYLVYPLQIILLIPFYRAGEFVFNAEPLSLSASKVVGMIKEDVWAAIKFLWDTTLHAVVVWCILAPILVAILYYLLLPLVKRLPFKLADLQ